MQRNAKFLAEYLKTATGRDFSIEAGTEGKNAIVETTANDEALKEVIEDEGYDVVKIEVL